MLRSGFLIIIIGCLFVNARCQFADVDFKVYEFAEGLSHRNTFKIGQDSSGYIWIATINGLNRFDGYQFIHYTPQSEQNPLPFEANTDMLITEDQKIWLANPDMLTLFDPVTNHFDTTRIKDGKTVVRQSRIPYNLLRTERGEIWMATYDETTATTQIQKLLTDGEVRDLLTLEGQYSKRPMEQVKEHIYLGAVDNELWRLDQNGKILEKLKLPQDDRSLTGSRIVQLEYFEGQLYILLLDGRLYTFDEAANSFIPHRLNEQMPRDQIAGTLYMEEDGDIWVGGQGVLWYFNHRSERLINYDEPIRQIIKNTCSYRQLYKDKTEVIWAATDFGMVKIVQADNLFTNYLSGGSEYCSNIYCSTRGITEDEEGNIYISYYNSIHKLDPVTNGLRLLFPANDYFNYPFGLTYLDGALWTGNGRRIDIETLQVDTIFDKPNTDLGAVEVDKDGWLWFGFQSWFFQYDPRNKKLYEFEDQYGKWDTIHGDIAHIYQGKTDDYVWVSTLANGIFKIDKEKGRLAHYHTGESSPVPLRHNKVNVVQEDDLGYLWMGTGDGLHRLEIATDSLTVYSTDNGLPNPFINGLLLEGDSVIWLSTDNGLCRFSRTKENCLNYFQRDGLSSNEFNRISFFKASDNRMYFGGLNGVNAFYPDDRFLERKGEQQEAPILLTQFTRFNDRSDSLYIKSHGLETLSRIELSPWDKVFSFSFALADYRQPLENLFSYKLESYDKDWTPATSINLVRYHNIPAGNYTFRVRASSGKDDWNQEELSVVIKIKEAFYRTWQFWLIFGLFLLGFIFGIMRYRIHLIRQRELVLERIVKERTRQLEEEKQKSEELLLNILPAETAEELKVNGVAKAKRHNEVTVMFSDFKGFSRISENLEPEQLVTELDQCFRAFDQIIEKYGLEKIKTIGDAYLCVGGISGDHKADVHTVVLAALEIQEYLKQYGLLRKQNNRPYFEARIGIHTGPLVAGVVGIKKFAYDIWGDTVNIASRMETHGAVGRVNISETTYQLIQSDFDCSPHGEYTEARNGAINMYLVKTENTPTPQ